MLLTTMPNYKKEFVEMMEKIGVMVITTNVQLSREGVIKMCEDTIIDFKPEIVLVSSLASLAEKIRELKQVFLEMKVAYRITSSHDTAVTIASLYNWVDLMIVLYHSLISGLQNKIPNCIEMQ